MRSPYNPREAFTKRFTVMNITGFTQEQKQALLDLLASDGSVTSEESRLLAVAKEVFQL